MIVVFWFVVSMNGSSVVHEWIDPELIPFFGIDDLSFVVDAFIPLLYGIGAVATITVPWGIFSLVSTITGWNDWYIAFVLLLAVVVDEAGDIRITLVVCEFGIVVTCTLCGTFIWFEFTIRAAIGMLAGCIGGCGRFAVCATGGCCWVKWCGCCCCCEWCECVTICCIGRSDSGRITCDEFT